jgi:hypothetical protein
LRASGGYKQAVGEVVLWCGVAVMEQVPRGSKHDKGRGDGVAGGDGGGGAHGGGHACGGHG